MALQLNGTTDYLDLGASRVLNFAENAPFTVACWVETSSPQGVLLSFRPEPDTYDMITVSLAGGKLAVLVRHHGNPFHPGTTSSTVAIHDGRWHHFAVVRTGKEVLLYLDGALNARLTSPFPGPHTGKVVTGRSVLGVEAGMLAERVHPLTDRSRLQGCIDELHVFGDALGEKEIQKLRSPR
jgi:hypothetical protein